MHIGALCLKSAYIVVRKSQDRRSRCLNHPLYIMFLKHNAPDVEFDKTPDGNVNETPPICGKILFHIIDFVISEESIPN